MYLKELANVIVALLNTCSSKRAININRFFMCNKMINCLQYWGFPYFLRSNKYESTIL